MAQCHMCDAMISDAEAQEASEIAGPGLPTLCTGCAHDVAEQEEEAEQAMIIPLQCVPTANDLHCRVELPAKFTYRDETPCDPNHELHSWEGRWRKDGEVCTRCGKKPEDIMQYIIGCGICNQPTRVTLVEYNRNVIPVCNVCEAQAAELSGS